MNRPFIHAIHDRVRVTIAGISHDLDPAMAMAIAMDLHLAARSAADVATRSDRALRELRAALDKEGL